MTEKILVAYASKHGATQEIAGKVVEELLRAELPCELKAVTKVKDLGPYRAVVLGLAVYAGSWPKEAVAFLEAQVDALSERQTWLFSSGPTGEGDPEELLKGWRYPDGQAELVERIAPENIAIFHGAIDRDKLNMLERGVVRMVKAPTGDFRDWEMIKAWARGIADELKERVLA